MAQGTTVLELSRQSTVKLVSQTGNSSGTGFFIDDRYLLTCFHVVAALSVQGPTVNWCLYPDLKAELPTGETIDGAVVTPPTQADPSPLTQDFAVVKLQRKPQPVIPKLVLFSPEIEEKQCGFVSPMKIHIPFGSFWRSDEKNPEFRLDPVRSYPPCLRGGIGRRPYARLSSSKGQSHT
jgi:hypothetical protein